MPVPQTHSPEPRVEALQRKVASFMARVGVNQVQKSIQNGAPTLIKRRRRGGSTTIAFGNLFLATAHAGIHMFVRTREWIDWEIHCYRLLYPERGEATRGHGPSVILPAFTGISLRQLLLQNGPHEPAFIAAARELRRVHQIPCPHFNAPWSHGDLHLDNILYDPGAGRATLIDFDTRHDRRLSPVQRHADDLNTMLLELMALEEHQWRGPATTLLEQYARPQVLRALDPQLVVPRGVPKIFWHTRTNGAPTRVLMQRLQAVREILRSVLATASEETKPQARESKEPGDLFCACDH